MEYPFCPPEDAEPVEVPSDMLSTQALRGVAEAFVLREGTDYGLREFTHDEKVEQVLASIGRGEARVLFDPRTDSVTIVLKDQRAT